MRRINKTVSIILFSIMLFFIHLSPVLASTATISVSSSNSKVVVSNTFSVTIKVKSSSYFGTVEFTPSYDKNKFKMTSGKTSVIDYGKAKERKYTYKFKAIGTGTGKITVKSVAVRDYGNEKEMSIKKGSASVTVITQSQLEASYSKNNNLKSLSIDGIKLSPAFNKNTTTYKVNANSNTTKVNIKGKVEDSKSKVSGLGSHKVSEGENKIKVIVTAQNGSTKTYTIIINVIDPNPIKITIGDKNYTVVKRESSLDMPTGFDKTTVTINEQKIPGFYNETTNYTLVGLKDEEGDIELFKYDSETNSYSKYINLDLEKMQIIPLPIENEFGKDFEKTTINIDEVDIESLRKKDSDFYIIHALDFSTGKDDYYLYDSVTNTMVRYSEDKAKVIDNSSKYLSQISNYKKMILLLGVETVIIIVVLIGILFSKMKKNKRRRKYLQEKILAEKKKKEELQQQEEIKEEVKEEIVEEIQEEKPKGNNVKKKSTKNKTNKNGKKKKEVLKDDKSEKETQNI